MISIEREPNIEILRQVALLQHRELKKLHERLKKLTLELARLKGQNGSEALALEREHLQELLAQRERALFGDSSEKRPGLTAVEPKEPSPRRGHGPRPQPELPIVEQIHDLPEPDRICPVCGETVVEMGDQTEDSEEITLVERKFVVVQHRRKKYRCRCNACVVTAPPPPKLAPGGRYSVEFAVEVAASKYLDHLPLERQATIMRRESLAIDSQTLWDQMNLLAHHLTPTVQAIRRTVIESAVVGADETPWRLMGGHPKRWWVWALTNGELAAYAILDSRSKEAASEVLRGYRGIVIADGYGAYDALTRAGPSFRLAHCWAHVRRKFVEIEENFPAESKEMLDLLRELYAVEALVASANGNEEALRLRAELRATRSKEIVRRIRDWALAQRPLPRSGLGQAIDYMFGLWTGLTAFLDDPKIPIDNNAVERALRGVAVGRKNHYGSRSRRGTEVAALFYSLFESAKLAGVEPKSYVLQAAHTAIAEPGTVTLPASLLS
jgi:transposase